MTDRWAWLFDIGSTFTKLAVVPLDAPERMLTAQAPTTVTSDVCHGMRQAVAAVEQAGGPELTAGDVRLASSSAAGGLAMVVSGLVPRLSLEAGRIGAAGAGAKLVGSWGYRLTDSDVCAIEAARPDLILLTGGTDGGDVDTIRRNAAALTRLQRCPTVIVAGNREVADEVGEMLAAAGIDVRVAPNLMPELDRLEVEPVRALIRAIFLEQIIQAKGIDGARQLVDGDILPTPRIVLDAVGLLAEDVFDEPTVAVEVGGATTNVHSYCDGEPHDRRTVRRGFTEPMLKRTVEGDLGVRLNAQTILSLAGAGAIGEGAAGYVAEVTEEPARLPATPAEQELDAALAAYAGRTAIERHAGRLREMMLPTGPVTVQEGKDLTDVSVLVVTGGAVINAPSPQRTVRHMLDGHDELALVPRSPRVLLDRRYVLYATGLLSQVGLRAEAAELIGSSLVDVAESPREAHAVH